MSYSNHGDHLPAMPRKARVKRSILSARKKAFAAGLVLLAANAVLPAAVVSFDRPGMDVWMYDNGFNRGFREDSPVFGGPPGVNGSDDRLGQLVLGWNTALAGIPAGQGAANYAITRVTLYATHVNHNVFAYDPTYDGYRTYLDTSDPNFLADSDTGRPIEVYGLGLRNGFTDLAVPGSTGPNSFGESSAYSTGSGEHTRNAFAFQPGSPRPDGDVSENVTEGFETTPFAIASANDLTPGDLVPADTEFKFELNLSNTAVLAYLRAALHNGELGLTISSMHPSSFSGTPGAQTYPRFYTRDYYDFVPEVVPRLEIEYTIVPEPGVANFLILAAAALAATRALRRRDYYS